MIAQKSRVPERTRIPSTLLLNYINHALVHCLHHQEQFLSFLYVYSQTDNLSYQPANLSSSTMSLIQRTNIFDPFSLDIWDPFQGFPFTSTIANVPASASETAAFVNARIDLKETPEAHVFKADLPGLKKEEVKVEVEEGRVLQISGERSREQEEKKDKWHRIERSSGKFLRRFRLPENAKMDQVKASMENGVLTVTVPKEEEKKAEVKAIEISG